VPEPADRAPGTGTCGTQSPNGGVARAALLIAGITIAARVVGLVRTAVFARTVGSGCVGSVYQTANAIPNIVFDVVAGGMLSAAVVPLLAGSLAGGDRVRAGRIASALLTWSLLALGAITLLVIAAAGPLSSLLLGGIGGARCPGAHDLGRRMLITFAPQIALYGIAIIVSGMLQAGRRFAWPAIAPLASSLTVIVAYLWFAALVRPDATPRSLSGLSQLILAGGTTLGVLVLALCQVPAAAGLHLSLRWSFRFPPGSAGIARAAVLAGSVSLAGQQLSTAVMLRLANSTSAAGVVVVVTLAQAVFLLPWAVLAVPLATSVFPRLADLGGRGAIAEFRSTLDGVVGVLMTVCAAGAAALFASAEPIAGTLLDRGAPGHAGLAPATAVFACGLLGWSLVALLGRALYAAGEFRASAVSQAAGWIVAIAAQLVLALLVPDRFRAAALAAGYAIGVSVSASLLMRACVARNLLSGGSSLARVLASSGSAAIVGGTAGALIGRLARDTGVISSLGLGICAAALGAIVATALATGLGGGAVGVRALQRAAGR
jgi:putative peptidoglycan lipid II flippase